MNKTLSQREIFDMLWNSKLEPQGTSVIRHNSLLEVVKYMYHNELNSFLEYKETVNESDTDRHIMLDVLSLISDYGFTKNELGLSDDEEIVTI